MTKWLASVQSLNEAQSLSKCLPDILDMKQPAKGALGALSVDDVKSIVTWVSGKTLTSATIGDLPMQSEIIVTAMQEMALSGVDYVKIGLFNDDGLETCIKQLEQNVKTLAVPVIAVLFADEIVDLSLLQLLKNSGFSGVMVDTANKDGSSLLDHWPVNTLQRFVDEAKALDLLCGLAGALQIDDISQLNGLGADYLGFRSALCLNRNRTSQLRPELAEMIKNALRVKLPQAS